MPERIKELRKELNLSQIEFAARLGISRGNIAAYEVGKNAPSDAVIELICRTFSVNREWLLRGEGEMFVRSDEFSLDEFLREHDADQLEIAIVKAYFELDPDLRRLVLQKFKSNLERDQETVEDLEEEYEKSIKRASGSAPGTDSTASNSTAENA